MKDYLFNEFIEERKIYIKDIPAILLRPKTTEEVFKTIVFYHGWSSSKESQRIRGQILAMFGYQVLLPDSIYHGERNPIDYDSDNGELFWDTVLNTMEEFDLVHEGLINKYDADQDNITVMGHSMGGFISAGVFTHNEKLRSVITLNGSFAWDHFNSIFKEENNLKMTEKQIEQEVIINRLDPIKNIEKLKDRPILMLHGGSDTVVSVECQRLFLRTIEPINEDKRKARLIKYPNLGHFVTTNMMEDGIRWLRE